MSEWESCFDCKYSSVVDGMQSCAWKSGLGNYSKCEDYKKIGVKHYYLYFYRCFPDFNYSHYYNMYLGDLEKKNDGERFTSEVFDDGLFRIEKIIDNLDGIGYKETDDVVDVLNQLDKENDMLLSLIGDIRLFAKEGNVKEILKIVDDLENKLINKK